MAFVYGRTRLLCVFGLLCAIMLSCFGAVSAISCYVCNSRSDAGCALADRISNDYRECNMLQDRCLKVAGPGDLVVRSCAGSGSPRDAGCIINGDIKTCVCYDNYCNSAPTIQTSLILLVGLVLIYATYLL